MDHVSILKRALSIRRSDPARLGRIEVKAEDMFVLIYGTPLDPSGTLPSDGTPYSYLELDKLTRKPESNPQLNWTEV